MDKNTHIYNKFEHWSVEDCSCTACLYWQGKRRGCIIAECCCSDIRQEAARREDARRQGTATPSVDVKILRQPREADLPIKIY
jgi:hypothetical protein